MTTSLKPVEGCEPLQPGRPRFKPPDKHRSRDEIDPKLRATIRKLAAGESPWPFFLHGDVGGGKTCAGLCMVDVFGGWYLSVADLCEMLIAASKGQLSWSNGFARTVTEIWQAWTTSTLTVLDEIGTRGAVSDFQYETVKRAIDSREGQPAVFISNHDPVGLEMLYDDRIASRLASGTLWAVKGDRRLQGALRVVGA
jgi:hypothetical protein